MRVSRTNYVSPSKASYFYECKFRFIAETERIDIARTPANPAALIGSAVHSTIEYFLANESVLFSEIVENLQKRVFKLIERNLSSNKTLSYVCDKYGIERVCSFTQIGNSARYINRMLSEFGRREGMFRHSNLKQPDENYIGSEKALSSDKLQIAGKPDLTYVDDGGYLVVADFKTGKIRSVSDINETYLFQVACYGAMLKELTGRSEIKLRLIGADEDWMTSLTPELLNQVYFYSQCVKKDIPLNVVFDSADIASPGNSCANCSIRPNCLNYNKLLECSGGESSDFINPLDICGQVTFMAKENDLYTIRIKDPVGQLKQITSIPEGMVDPKLTQHSMLYLYNLKSRETTARSRLIANFHLINKENPENSAFQSFIRSS
jgi:hypothetical protein